MKSTVAVLDDSRDHSFLKSAVDKSFRIVTTIRNSEAERALIPVVSPCAVVI